MDAPEPVYADEMLAEPRLMSYAAALARRCGELRDDLGGENAPEGIQADVAELLYEVEQVLASGLADALIVQQMNQHHESARWWHVPESGQPS